MAMYSTSFGFRQPYQVLGAFRAQVAAEQQPSLPRQRIEYLLSHCSLHH
jgi:hypothetical protein